MRLKLALPKGRLLPATAAWLEEGGWGLTEYKEDSRAYRLKPPLFPQVLAKVFQEKDIPIQVAVGNYDLGVCGRDWLEEHIARFPSTSLVKIGELGYGCGELLLASSQSSPFTSWDKLKEDTRPLRLASEYPNLAEAMALKLRLRRFQVFPLWGAAQVYPPESADLVLVAQSSAKELNTWGLQLLRSLFPINACLIANKHSWQSKDLAEVMTQLPLHWTQPTVRNLQVSYAKGEAVLPLFQEGLLRLALPDGHQQPPTADFLQRVSLDIKEYAQGQRRTTLGLAGVMAKVIRPQDIPQQLACGNFDLGITGRDWLLDHLCHFPHSPVAEVLDLGFGRVRLVAVVSQELPANSIGELRQLGKEGSSPYLRIASEYVNITDRYAWDNHLSPYRLIPTWGASEAFLPEDADLLIENTQTGQTLAQQGLKVIDTLFESTACVVVAKAAWEDKADRLEALIQTFRRGLV